jgi:hypothetical protein
VTNIKQIMFPICAVICALALVYMASRLRESRGDRALSCLLVAFACKGISFTLSTPSVSQTVDKFTGVPNLAALGIHLFGGVASSAAIVMALSFWIHPLAQARSSVRIRFIAFCLVGLVLICLWAVAQKGSPDRSAHYLLQNMNRPIVAVYLLIYVSAFAFSMIEIIRLCWKPARDLNSSWLRHGLRITELGAGIYFLYCANRAWGVVAVQFGLDPLAWEIVTPIVNSLGIALLATGLTIPSWGPQLAPLAAWIRLYVQYQRIYPLWHALTQAVPEVRLDSGALSFPSRAKPNDLHYRVHRQVVEVSDALLLLSPFMSRSLREAATLSAAELNLTAESSADFVEAMCLRDAIRSRHSEEALVPRAVPGNSARQNFVDPGNLARLESLARFYKEEHQPHRERIA